MQLACRCRECRYGIAARASLRFLAILSILFISPLIAAEEAERGWNLEINVSTISKNYDDDRLFFGLKILRNTQSNMSFGFELSSNFAEVDTFEFVDYIHLQNYFGGYLNYSLFTKKNTSVIIGAALGYALTDTQSVDGDVSGSGPRSSTYIEPRVTIAMPKLREFARPVLMVGFYSILNTGMDQNFNVVKLSAGIRF